MIETRAPNGWVRPISRRSSCTTSNLSASAFTAALPIFEKYGADFVVRGGAYEVMEGNERERNFVIGFKDRATAMACYKCPEYQAAVAIRQKYSDADLIIIDGPA